jgi:hypothetical protein
MTRAQTLQVEVDKLRMALNYIADGNRSLVYNALLRADLAQRLGHTPTSPRPREVIA